MVIKFNSDACDGKKEQLKIHGTHLKLQKKYLFFAHTQIDISVECQ